MTAISWKVGVNWSSMMQDQSTVTALSGLIEFLESKPGVSDVKLEVGRPLSTADLTAWERLHLYTLPQDLKQLYLTNNGITLHWSFHWNDTTVNLGRININGLTQLKHLGGLGRTDSTAQPSLLDLDDSDNNDAPWKPSFGGPCTAFALDFCPSCGHTCLVYNTQSDVPVSSVWLLDLALSWHYLCPSLSDYVRLAIVHLGLKQWPYALTSNRLSPQFERWFHMFIPKRLEVDVSDTNSGPTPSAHSGDKEKPFLNTLDITKLHIRSRDRRKSDVKQQTQTSRTKK